MANAKTLGLLYGEYLSDCINPVNRPIEINLAESATPFFDNQEAFTLNSPAFASVKEVKCIETDCSGVVVRALIGYATASRIQENLNQGYFVLGQYVNAMLISASKHLNVNSFDLEYKTFKRPGPEGNSSIFRELENAAAFEFRLYIKKQKGESENE